MRRRPAARRVSTASAWRSTDFEALRRAQGYLDEVGVDTHESASRRPSGTNARRGRSAPARRRVQRDHRTDPLGPCKPTHDWRKGFLAGIFDAEGSGGGGAAHLATPTAILIDWTQGPSRARVRHRGRGSTRERASASYASAAGCGSGCGSSISRTLRSRASGRSRGGPQVRREAAGRLGRAARVEMPLYDITTGTGDFIADGVVSHNCFARPTHKYLDMDAARGLRARDRREGQRARGAAGGAGAAVVEGRAHRDGDEHRPVPVGRGALQADARDLGGDAGLSTRARS